MQNITPPKAEKQLKKQFADSSAKSAYIHMPFCRKKCSYCAFTSFGALNFIDDYIKKITKEIKYFYDGTPLNTLYIGGGTPSLLEIKYFEKILSLFNFEKPAKLASTKTFPDAVHPKDLLSKDYTDFNANKTSQNNTFTPNDTTQSIDTSIYAPEITVEINPESADINLLSALFKMGVNRLSIGVQSFDDDILKSIGRLHTAKKAKDIIFLAQDIGFENISIDLIYGLPGQKIGVKSSVSADNGSSKLLQTTITQEDSAYWENTLEIAKSLDIAHISLYGLKIEENTLFYKKPPKHLPNDDIQADMYEFAVNFLEPKFSLYEISNFAKTEKFYSKHNLNYWNDGKYYGFGISAAGFLNNIRYQNTKNFKEYMENPLSTKDLSILTPEERLDETIFLGFRKREGINVKKINEKFMIDFDKKYEEIVTKFISTGHIEKTENGYRLTISGILISNLILSEFLC